MLRNQKYFSFITFPFVAFFVPTLLFTNYVLEQFYVGGSSLLDVGWFSYMMTEANSWPLPNPQAISETHLGSTFFNTHFSLFFYLLSFLHSYFLFFIPGPVYFSLFIGSMYGIISLSVFIAGAELLPRKTNRYLWILLIISILTSMNGTALALIGFPHIEMAIPALILLFVALYFTERKILSYIVFLFLLTIREDAGFYIFALLTIVSGAVLVARGPKSLDKNLIIIGILGLTYSIIAIMIQSTWFPGDNALERVYLGTPHFAHLTPSFMLDRAQFILSERKYIMIPILLTVVMAIYTRNIFLLSSLMATLPWLILSFVAISPMPNSLSNYYAFPLIIVSSWAVFAFLIAKKYELLPANYHTKLLMSILLITGVSIGLFPDNSGNADDKPWKNFSFHNYKSISAVEDFVTKFNSTRNEFGQILFDEPMAALLVDGMKKSEYVYVNNFLQEKKTKADTVIFYRSNKAVVEDILLKNGLNNVYHIENTSIRVATKKIINHTGMVRLSVDP